MRGRIRAGAFGLGCAGLAVLTLVTPAAGERNAPDQIQSANISGDCQDASMNTPRGEAGDVKLTADIRDGATVAPGQDIALTLSWDPKRWSGPDLDRALDCVRVKGELAPDLSAEDAPTANDGVFEYRLHVPDDIKPGCDICAEGFLAGDAAGGGPQAVRSDRYCFMSGRPVPPPPTPPVTGPPAPPVTSPPAPPATVVPTTTTTAARIPTEVAGITAGRPAPTLTPAPAPAPAPAAAPAELPRTGSGAGRTGTAGGGLALCLGGLAVMGGSGRRTRRRTSA
jgi:hypothetical protein